MTVRQGTQAALFRKVGVPGSQRDFYELHPDAWTASLKAAVVQSHLVLDILARTKPYAANELASANIEETQEFFQFAIEQTEKIIEQWEQLRKKRQ